MLSNHRAGGDHTPENTMMALRDIIENADYTVDMFEFDIHLTADGDCVLLHDGTLDRTSNSREHFGQSGVRPEDKTLSELRQLNMGENFVTPEGDTPYKGLRGEVIPDDLRITTLSEALTYLESSGDYSYIIEIKNGGETGFKAADILYDTLQKFGALQRTVVGTFHNEITEYVDTTYPDMLRSAGFNECIEFYIYSLLKLPAAEDKWQFVALQIPTTDYTVNLGTSRLVNYAHKHNIAVQYWTINDPAEMARLQSIGADAIMTDVPDQATMLVQP
jgi:glycerophosphoryl diester phosphodiesterase